MKNLREMAERLSDWFEFSAILVSVILAINMVVVVNVNVFFRYVVQDSFQWVEELSVYSMIWMGLLCASVVYKKRGHPAIDVFVAKLPKSVQIVISWLIEIVIAAFLITVIYKGFSYAFESGSKRFTNSLGIPLTLPYLAPPVGCALIFLQQILTLIVKGVKIPGDHK
ncbi:MAG: TRAP transporter small permease [Rhodospirillales bacterium]|nr:TRAP transporter small permease [Rhodospirillales bacterium]